jgi:hypothetical protein
MKEKGAERQAGRRREKEGERTQRYREEGVRETTEALRGM